MVHSSARVAVVENIWAVLSSRYGHTWSTKQGVDDQIAMNDWCDAVAGLHLPDIQVGLEKTKRDPRYKSFPPNSMEFRALCIDDEEDKERLFQELVNWKELDQDKKSRKGLFIAQKIDYTNFRRADLERARKMFNAAYSKLLKHIADGKELPEFFTEIEYEAPPPMPMEKRSSFFADLMKAVDNPQGAQ